MSAVSIPTPMTRAMRRTIALYASIQPFYALIARGLPKAAGFPDPLSGL
jgi:hypothetical protein